MLFAFRAKSCWRQMLYLFRFCLPTYLLNGTFGNVCFCSFFWAWQPHVKSFRRGGDGVVSTHTAVFISVWAKNCRAPKYTAVKGAPPEQPYIPLYMESGFMCLACSKASCLKLSAERGKHHEEQYIWRCHWADREMMVGGTLKTLIHLYSSCVRGQLLLETKIPLVMDQEILLLNTDAKKFVSTVFYATPFPAAGSRLDHREGYSHILQLW